MTRRDAISALAAHRRSLQDQFDGAKLSLHDSFCGDVLAALMSGAEFAVHEEGHGRLRLQVTRPRGDRWNIILTAGSVAEL